LSEAKR